MCFDIILMQAVEARSKDITAWSTEFASIEVSLMRWPEAVPEERKLNPN